MKACGTRDELLTRYKAYDPEYAALSQTEKTQVDFWVLGHEDFELARSAEAFLSRRGMVE